MAYEENLTPFSVPANADLSSYQYRFVDINSSGKAALAAAGVGVDGILQNKPAAANRAASVAGTPGQISKMVAGAAITAGADISPDSVGRGVTATSGDVVAAKALEAASGAGVIISVLLKLQSEPLS